MEPSNLPLNPAPAGPGRIVHYRLTADDAQAINRRRTSSTSIEQSIADDCWPVGAQAHIGTEVSAGDYFPMMVTVCKDGTTLVSGQVFLDGNDVFWARGSEQGEHDGQWCWPPGSPMNRAPK